MLTPEELARTLANHLHKTEEDKGTGMGAPTELRCHCGGTLHRFDPSASRYKHLENEAGRPRYSRRKRQIKKNYKTWTEKEKTKLFMCAALARPPTKPKRLSMHILRKSARILLHNDKHHAPNRTDSHQIN